MLRSGAVRAWPARAAGAAGCTGRPAGRVGGPVGPVRRSSSRAAKAGPCPAAIAFDIDGVLKRGQIVIPCSPEAVQAIFPKEKGGMCTQGGLPCVFLTNGGGVTEQAMARKLNKWLNVHVDPDQVILSHTPMKELVPRFGHQLCLVAGYGDVAHVARSYGFQHVVTSNKISLEFPDLVPHRLVDPTRKPEEEHVAREHLRRVAAILVFHDPNDWLLELQILTDVLAGHLQADNDSSQHSPPPLFFSNPDFLWSGAFSAPRFAQGAFRVALAALYKELTGKPLEYVNYGKPEPKTYRYAEKKLMEQAVQLGYASGQIAQFYGIGDNPHADIRGANQAKQHGLQWNSVLVETGSIDIPEHCPPLLQPDLRFADVLAAVRHILEVTSKPFPFGAHSVFSSTPSLVFTKLTYIFLTSSGEWRELL
eukprot:g2628.t1